MLTNNAMDKSTLLIVDDQPDNIYLIAHLLADELDQGGQVQLGLDRLAHPVDRVEFRDPLAGLIGDSPLSVEGMGDGGDRDVCRVGDVVDGHPYRGFSRSALSLTSQRRAD